MQTSSKPLSQQHQDQLLKQLTTVLADLDHPRDVRAFLQEFLTSTELSVLTKRLAILQRLDTGLSYEAIKQELNVSSATISSVSEFAQAPAVQKALKLLRLDTKLEQWLPQFKK